MKAPVVLALLACAVSLQSTFASEDTFEAEFVMEDGFVTGRRCYGQVAVQQPGG